MGFSYSPELYQDQRLVVGVVGLIDTLLDLHPRFGMVPTFTAAHQTLRGSYIFPTVVLGDGGRDHLRHHVHRDICRRSQSMPDKLCSGMVYLMVATMNAANWLCTCIAINLMLIIVFHINPRRRRLERWYVVGSFIMGLGPPLVPAALNHFGKDTTPWGNCFMRDVEVHSRIVKLILDVYLWQALSCLVAIISTASVLFALLRTSRQTTKALFAGNPLNASLSSATLGTLSERFNKIALRISAYPIALVIINTLLTTADLVYTEANTGVQNLAQWILFCVFICLYGGRGLVLGLLGVFVDPCLRNGYREARRHRARTSPSPPPTTLHHTLAYGTQNTSLRGVTSLPYTPPQPSSGGRHQDSDPTGSTGSQDTDETKQKDEHVDLEMAEDFGRSRTQPRRRSRGGPAASPIEGGVAGLGFRLAPLPGQSLSMDEAEELYNHVESQL